MSNTNNAGKGRDNGLAVLAGAAVTVGTWAVAYWGGVEIPEYVQDALVILGVGIGGYIALPRSGGDHALE